MQKVIDLSLRLEGLPRHSSTHAAGVVISGVPLTDVVPLQLNDVVVTTQFPMGTLEELGLLKMDFLGLRNAHGHPRRAQLPSSRAASPRPTWTRRRFDDPAVYEMIARGDTRRRVPARIRRGCGSSCASSGPAALRT